MTSPLIAFLIKLPLALLVFLLVAYAGTVSKRIAGVLLTFPILNGIAIIASDDPVTVADAIYPLVIFNCVLFAIVISFARVAPPVDALPRRSRLVVRVIIWAIAWFAGAYLITDFREQIFGAAVLLVGSVIVAVAFMILCWSGAAPPAPNKDACVTHHGRAFTSFWLNSTGLWRIVLFALAYGCLFSVLARRARREMGRHGERVATARLIRARRADRRLEPDGERSAADARHRVSRAAAGHPVQLGILAPARWRASARPRCSRAICCCLRCGPSRRSRCCCWFRASFRRVARCRSNELAHVRIHGPHKPPRARDLALSAAAPAQSGRLVAVGTGCARRSAAHQQADPALGRLRRLPLVPRDGARKLRGRGDGARDERAVRQHQGRPRGAARHRPDLHERRCICSASRAAGR